MTLKEIPTARLVEMYMSFRRPSMKDRKVIFGVGGVDSPDFINVDEQSIREELNSRPLVFGDFSDYLNLSAIQMK